MDELQKDVEDLNSVDLPDEQEEPWCSTCRAFTDYRRKWDTVNRSDLDGGIYSDNGSCFGICFDTSSKVLIALVRLLFLVSVHET